MTKQDQTNQLIAYLQQLKELSFTGNCILAELHRIWLLTPVDFVDASSSEFNKILIDFSYFENRVSFNNFVEGTEEGSRLDKDFFTKFANFLEIFGNFIHKFYSFILDLREFSSEFAKWKEKFTHAKGFEEFELLAAQILYLFGIILLLIEQKFPGSIRERIFVAFYRLSVVLDFKQLEVIAHFFRKRHETYESSFLNVGIDDHFIRRIIDFLRFQKEQCDGWIENALYVCLYFESKHDTLHNQASVMRQIIDNHFHNRWILYLHIDLQVNLCEKWRPYKAANSAFTSNLDVTHMSLIAEQNFASLRSLVFPVGLLSLEMFEHYEKLLLESNAALRWLILHFSKDHLMTRNKKFTEFSIPNNRVDELVMHLKQLAYFEYKFKQAYKFLQNNRAIIVNKLQHRISDNFSQILAFLNNITKNKNDNRMVRVINWLESVKSRIDDMDLSDSDCKSQLDHLRVQISEMLHYQSETDQQQQLLHQFLLFALNDIQKLQNVCRLNPSFLADLNKTINSTYIFQYLEENCCRMQKLLQEEAPAIKYIFLKVSDAVSTLAFESVDDENSKKLCSFYYKLLELKLRAIIQAIPHAIFDEMDKINEYFPTDVSSIFLEIKKVRNFINSEKSEHLADLTFKISKLALGVSNTCINRLGDVKIQPKALLSDGIKKELNVRLKQIFASNEQSNLIAALNDQSTKLNQFRKAFLFVCDHVGIRNGVQMWVEQSRRILMEIADKRNSQKTTECAIVPSLGCKPMLLAERIYNFIMTATSPPSTLYKNMESIWHSPSANRQIKFTSNFFNLLENWLLFAINNSLVKRKLVKEFLQLNEYVDATLIESPNSLSQFTITSSNFNSLAASLTSGSYEKLFNSLAKLGQFFLLYANLQLFAKAEFRTQMGVLHGTEYILKRLITHRDRLGLGNCIMSADNMVQKYSQLKNVNAIIFFISVIFIFIENLASNKKYGNADILTLCEGVKLILMHPRLWNLIAIDGKNLFIRKNSTKFLYSFLNVISN